jgi:hypothetical protein
MFWVMVEHFFDTLFISHVAIIITNWSFHLYCFVTMQRFARPLANIRKVSNLGLAKRVVVRSFSSTGDEEKLTIRSNIDQMTGLRWQELEAKSRGQVFFNVENVQFRP